MKGKTCLVTGANGGIGYETARALAKKGASIVMVARNWFMKLLSPFGRPPEQGAVPSVFAASASELDGVTGQYFDPKCRAMDASPASYDRTLALRLRKKAAEMTGIGI